MPKQEVFLATTALEEFWDTSMPILFLGEWCRRYSRRLFWEPIDGLVLSGPWKNKHKLFHAYNYVNKLYEILLDSLTEKLNEIHGTSYSKRYWRIVIGPWLSWFTSVLFDRYSLIKKASEDYPDFYTIGLSERSYAIPLDTADFINKVCDDGYNLQLFSKILTFVGKDFSKKPYRIPNTANNSSAMPLLKKIAIKLYKLLAPIINTNAVYLKSSNFSRFVELKMFLSSKGKIVPIMGEVDIFPFLSKNEEIRAEFRELTLGNSEFEKLVQYILPDEIPQCFIEGFKKINEQTSYYPKNVKAIFSSNCWYFDEVFKQWAANSAEQGTLLLGAPHGGNYSSVKYNKSFIHELSITDKYYSWGLDLSSCGKKVKPMPVPMLIGRRIKKYSKTPFSILYATSSDPRYLLQFPFTVEQRASYIEWQKRFIFTVNLEVRPKIRVRLRAQDFGWDFTERWKDWYPPVVLENIKEISFLESLKKCSLFICDTLSTTFMESLWLNKPTIAFWDPNNLELLCEAQPYFEQLRKAEILYNSPEEAAEKLNSINYNNLSEWWFNSSVQEARKIFCRKFAMSSQDNIKLWVTELVDLDREYAAYNENNP